MAGKILTEAAILKCPHQGTITPQGKDPRVTINNSAVLTIGAGTIAGCILPKQNPFDQTITWTNGTTRVTASGKALLLDNIVTPCLATTQPFQAQNVQQKVEAT